MTPCVAMPLNAESRAGRDNYLDAGDDGRHQNMVHYSANIALHSDELRCSCNCTLFAIEQHGFKRPRGWDLDLMYLLLLGFFHLPPIAWFIVDYMYLSSMKTQENILCLSWVLHHQKQAQNLTQVSGEKAEEDYNILCSFWSRVPSSISRPLVAPTEARVLKTRHAVVTV